MAEEANVKAVQVKLVLLGKSSVWFGDRSSFQDVRYYAASCCEYGNWIRCWNVTEMDVNERDRASPRKCSTLPARYLLNAKLQPVLHMLLTHKKLYRLSRM